MADNNNIINTLKFANEVNSLLGQFYLDHYCYIIDNIKIEDVFNFETGLCVHWIAMNKLIIPLPFSLSKIILEYTSSKVNVTPQEMKYFDLYENEIIAKYAKKNYKIRANYYSKNMIVQDTMELHEKHCKEFLKHFENLFKDISKETIAARRKRFHKNYIHSFVSYILYNETLKLCVKNKLLKDVKWYESNMYYELHENKKLTEMKMKLKQFEEERKEYKMRNKELEGVVKVLKSKVRMLEAHMEEEEEEELEIVDEDQICLDEDGRPLKKRKV